MSDKAIRTSLPCVRGAPRRPISADKPRRGVWCGGLSSRLGKYRPRFLGEHRCNRTFGAIALAVGVLAAPGIEPSGKDRINELTPFAPLSFDFAFHTATLRQWKDGKRRRPPHSKKWKDPQRPRPPHSTTASRDPRGPLPQGLICLVLSARVRLCSTSRRPGPKMPCFSQETLAYGTESNLRPGTSF